jgi:hypothetical protein
MSSSRSMVSSISIILNNSELRRRKPHAPIVFFEVKQTWSHLLAQLATRRPVLLNQAKADIRGSSDQRRQPHRRVACRWFGSNERRKQQAFSAITRGMLAAFPCRISSENHQSPNGGSALSPHNQEHNRAKCAFEHVPKKALSSVNAA